MIEEAVYASRRVALAPGSVMLLYTDGISEPENEDGDEFGSERLAEILRREPAQGGRQLFAVIRERVEEFHTSGEQLHDDSTLVVVRRLE
jgi:sigma-B regulation protein RsbU (phosphoserine phosphatase)